MVRVRALPLTQLMVTGLAGLAYMVGRRDLAAVFLAVFMGLLRSDEMVTVKYLLQVQHLATREIWSAAQHR